VRPLAQLRPTGHLYYDLTRLSFTVRLHALVLFGVAVWTRSDSAASIRTFLFPRARCWLRCRLRRLWGAACYRANTRAGRDPADRLDRDLWTWETVGQVTGWDDVFAAAFDRYSVIVLRTTLGADPRRRVFVLVFCNKHVRLGRAMAVTLRCITASGRSGSCSGGAAILDGARPNFVRPGGSSTMWIRVI